MLSEGREEDSIGLDEVEGTYTGEGKGSKEGEKVEENEGECIGIKFDRRVGVRTKLMDCVDLVGIGVKD